MGQEGVQSSGLLLFPRLMPHAGQCSMQERWCLPYGTMTQCRDPGACPFSSLPRVTNTSSSSCGSSLDCSAFPLPEPKVCDSERNFVLYPVKSAPLSLAECWLTLVDRNSTTLIIQMLYGCHFLAQLLWAGKPSLECRPCACQWELPTAEVSI